MLQWLEPLGGAALDRNRPAVVAVGGDKVYSFGGMEVYTQEMHEKGERSIPDQMDVHVFNTVALRWIKLPAQTTETGQRPAEVPPARINHNAVLIDNTVYVCGGRCFKGKQESRNELYGFDVDDHRWFRPEVLGTVPPWMGGHSNCVVGKVMYVYGAWCKWYEEYHDFMSHADMYNLDTSTMVWSLINTGGTAQPVSEYHSATAIGTKMFVFGGNTPENSEGGYGCHNIRVFDTETNCWLSSRPSAQPHPDVRWFHAAFAYNGELYIFAGKVDYNKLLNDLWKFNPETFCWKKVEPKGKQPSERCGMGSCMVGDRIILFGGRHGGRPCNDLLILDLSPSLKTLCKLAVIQHCLEQSELPHDIRWELAAMTDNISGPISSHLVYGESLGTD